MGDISAGPSFTKIHWVVGTIFTCFNRSIGQPAPHLHRLYFLCTPWPVQYYNRRVGQPAPHLQSLYIGATPASTSITMGVLVSLHHIYIHFIYWETLASLCFTIAVLVGLHCICMPYIFDVHPACARFYNMRVGRPAPRLHSFYILGDPRLVKDVQLEY